MVPSIYLLIIPLYSFGAFRKINDKSEKEKLTSFIPLWRRAYFRDVLSLIKQVWACGLTSEDVINILRHVPVFSQSLFCDLQESTANLTRFAIVRRENLKLVRPHWKFTKALALALLWQNKNMALSSLSHYQATFRRGFVRLCMKLKKVGTYCFTQIYYSLLALHHISLLWTAKVYENKIKASSLLVRRHGKCK